MSVAVQSPHHHQLGSYSVYTGVTVTVEKGAAIDKATRTARQLASFLHMMTRTDLEDPVKECLWMATDMAEELLALLPMVAQDACQMKKPAGFPAFPANDQQS